MDSRVDGAHEYEHEHPTEAEVKSLLQEKGSASTQGASRVVRHLLRECAACQERSRAQLRPKGGYDYSAAFVGAERKLADFFAEGRPSPVVAEILSAELRSLPKAEQKDQVCHNPRFKSRELAELLIESSHATRYRDVSEMLHLAELAQLVAETCTVEDTGSAAKLADMRGRAWGHFGTSLRAAGLLREAEEAITTAQAYVRRGTGDPSLQARTLEQKASLRKSQGRYPESIELAKEAAAIFLEIGQTHNFATALVHEAMACHYAGMEEEAIAVLNRAIPLIDPEKNPNLLLAACHNLALGYIALDRPAQALSLYFEARELYKEFEDDIILLRASWQEGQLLRDLGYLTAAEATLLQARAGFVERNLAHEVAMVSLDLAWVYVKVGNIDSLKQTVSEAIPIFTALRVGREALAALLQLQHAAGQEQQALELIRMLNTRLAPLASRTNK
ncbi:MAG TPA: tetratricopeptide repeat protein [Thermoanaerobaculia bacterium]|nr:tetratricopeptide repeat protein [Thermoanaerobaculia bacterium]